MFFTAVQCSTPGSLWYLLVKLSSLDTSGLVHIMAYMIEPMAEAYGTLLIVSLSFTVAGHCVLLNILPDNMGNEPFFALSIMNLFRTLSRYVLWLKAIRRLCLPL